MTGLLCMCAVIVVLFGVSCTVEQELAVPVSAPPTLYSTESARLTVTLKGTVLSWHLQWNGSSEVTGYYIQVYTRDSDNTETHTEWTTDTTYDLLALRLPQGVYHILVLSITETGNGPFSEPIVYTVKDDEHESHPKASTMAVVAISCVLAIAIALGSVLFAWTMWRLKAGRGSPNPGVKMESTSHVETCRDIPLAKNPSVSSTSVPRKLSTDHTYECLSIRVHNKPDGDSNDVDSSTTALVPQSANTSDDLPYGYVSPMDINTPQSRSAPKSENKYVTFESQIPPSSGPSSVLSTSEHSHNEYLMLLHR